MKTLEEYVKIAQEIDDIAVEKHLDFIFSISPLANVFAAFVTKDCDWKSLIGDVHVKMHLIDSYLEKIKKFVLDYNENEEEN